MRVIRKYWEDKLGEYRYEMVEVDASGKIADRVRGFYGSGDKAWARRNAKHYGIEIEEEDAD
jgi:hypothetical protein